MGAAGDAAPDTESDPGADPGADPAPAIRSAEIIAVGTELLLGEIVDTNSAFLAAELASRSVDVYWSLRVGDNLERIRRAVAQALDRSDLVLLCGGLGPTDDDTTREAIAAAVGETPAVDAELERQLRARFASFARSMPERNLKQAWLIPSAEALPNPIGTAPGWLVRSRRQGAPRLLAALPGPPRELKRMWQRELLPRLPLPASAFHSTTLKSHGLGESTVAERLGDLTRGANPSVATYAKRDGVHVRVAAKGDDAAQARALVAPTAQRVATALGEHLWGRDGDELPALVGAALATSGERLALLEGASGGLLCELLTAVPDAAESVLGGVVAWSPEAVAMLGRDDLAAAWKGAWERARKPSGPARRVPGEAGGDEDPSATLAALAVTLRERFAAHYGVVVGPLARRFAGDDSGAPEAVTETATVTVAVAGPTLPESADRPQRPFAGVELRVFRLPRHGDAWLRERVAFGTLALLWHQLRHRGAATRAP